MTSEENWGSEELMRDGRDRAGRCPGPLCWDTTSGEERLVQLRVMGMEGTDDEGNNEA